MHPVCVCVYGGWVWQPLSLGCCTQSLAGCSAQGLSPSPAAPRGRGDTGGAGLGHAGLCGGMCQPQGGVSGGAALCHWLALCHTTLRGQEAALPTRGRKADLEQAVWGGWVLRSGCDEQGLPGCHRPPLLHKGMRGLWGIPGPWGGNRGRGEVANRAPYPKRHHCIPRMQPGCGVQQGQMRYRAHHCSPNRPQPERCRRGGPFPSSWEPSSTPSTHCSEMAVQTQLASNCPGGGGSPFWRSCATQETGSTGGALHVSPPACWLAAMPVRARDAYPRAVGVPEPVCTRRHPAGKAVTHTVLALSRHTHVRAEHLHSRLQGHLREAAVGSQPWD